MIHIWQKPQFDRRTLKHPRTLPLHPDRHHCCRGTGQLWTLFEAQPRHFGCKPSLFHVNQQYAARFYSPCMTPCGKDHIITSLPSRTKQQDCSVKYGRLGNVMSCSLTTSYKLHLMLTEQPPSLTPKFRRKENLTAVHFLSNAYWKIHQIPVRVKVYDN
jgi:hypothetical protein